MGILRTAVGGVNMSYKGMDSLGTADLAQIRGGRSLFSQLNSDAFASMYPSIRAISNEYMTVMPYAINGKGERTDHQLTNVLYHPNRADSSVSFFEKMAVSTLVNKKTYLLVWRREGNEAKPGGIITPQNIGGFTFLEYPSVERRDGKTYYKNGAQEFTEDEVVVLPGGVDANDLYGGYSPAEASRRWATLDDYIADFQSGFFENGAVPAGQFIITARTGDEYNDIVDKLQERHRGAGKNGNVTYSHRPLDSATGKPVNAQVEWVPFAQSNKDIGFKDLFEQVNHRLDVAFGVPAIVQGIDSAAKYDNAQVADRNFAKRAVYPLLLRNYTQLTHELNRITNGLGVSLTFKYDFPTVSDEEKVNAEKRQIDSNIINTMVTAGYSLDSIVEAFDLPDTYKKLTASANVKDDDEDNTDVDEGGEVNNAPDPTKIDGVTPTNRKQVSNSTDLKPKALSEEDKVNYELQLREPARKLMNSQVERAVSALDVNNQAEATDEDIETFVDEMMVIIGTVLLYGGIAQWQEGRQLLLDAGITAPATEYVLSEEALTRYRNYLEEVARSYADDTAASIRATLSQGTNSGWTKQQTQDALRNIMNSDEWRITRLSTTEINRSGALSSVESMMKIQDEVEGVTIEKSMIARGAAPCEFCRARIGVWYAVDEIMVEKGAQLTGADGGIMVNNWDDNAGHDIHPHGQCVATYRIVR